MFKHGTSLKQKEFQIDRKSSGVQELFHKITPDKRVNLVKMKDFLTKRYKDKLADRILKHLKKIFNNFHITLPMTEYFDCVENFVNQEEAVIFFTMIINWL